jgi:hypothetical protein
MQFFGARCNLVKSLLYAINGGVDEKTEKLVVDGFKPIKDEVLDYEKVKKAYLYPNEKKAIYQNKDGRQGSMIYSNYIGKVVRHFKGNYYFIENICIS